MKKIIKALFYLSILFIVIFLPSFDLGVDISTILTAISLLFTILLGFFIATATTNYLNLQKLISNEDSCLISIYRLVKIVQPLSVENIAKTIDNYMISILDYDLLEYAAKTEQEFNMLLNNIDDISANDAANHPLTQNLQSFKSKLIDLRMESILAANQIITKKHWFILITLSSIISVILLSLRESNFLSSLIIAAIIIVIYETLSLLNEIDTNTFLANQIGYGDEPQSVFRAIEMPHYYPETALKYINKKNLPEKYRLGKYANFPKSFEKTIEFVSK